MVPQDGWLIMETPIKMDELGVPPFWKFPYPHVCCSNTALSTIIDHYESPST
jgi:hypothetical protein